MMWIHTASKSEINKKNLHKYQSRKKEKKEDTKPCFFHYLTAQQK